MNPSYATDALGTRCVAEEQLRGLTMHSFENRPHAKMSYRNRIRKDAVIGQIGTERGRMG
jgi:hypothetical protein